MFLEDKLQVILFEYLQGEKDTRQASDDMLNACINHIAERIKDGMKVKDVAAVIEQTDKIWRTFAKKNLPNSGDVFFESYIKPRILDHPNANQGLKNYFSKK